MLLDNNEVRRLYSTSQLPAPASADVSEACRVRGFEYRFTRDGEHLAFEASRPDGSTWIGVVELATREITDVSALIAESLGDETDGFSDRPVSDSRPVFSDRTLLFETTRSDRLYAWNLDSGGWLETPVTPEGSLWQISPSGSNFLAHRFSSNSQTHDVKGLYVEGLSQVGEFDNGSIGNCWNAAWVDNDRILCSYTTSGLGSGIILVDLSDVTRVECNLTNCPTFSARFSDHRIDTNRIELLPDNPRKNFQPVLAPDGDRYAFISELGDERALFVGRLSDPDAEPQELLHRVPSTLSGIPLSWVAGS